MQTTIHVGDTFTDPTLLDSFPVGTVITQGRRARWTKRDSGLWEHNTGGHWAAGDFGIRNLTVAEYPGGGQEFSMPAPTIERTKWRFRSGALAAANQHGVALQTVEGALRKMGCGRTDVDLPLGRGVRIPAPDRERLPEGSVIYSGLLGNPGQLGVYVRKGGEWVHVLGERAYMDAEVVVEAVAGNRERPEWLDREGTEEDQQAISQFKADAWNVGYELKRSHGWCGTYEEIVHRLGVSREDTRRITAPVPEGTRLHAEQAGSLPSGTLLMWRHSQEPDRWALFRRAPNVGNLAGTVRVCGSTASNDNYRRYMTVVSIADGRGNVGWLVPENPEGIWEALPSGTVFEPFPSEATEYVKCDDGRLAAVTETSRRRPTGQYSKENFGTGAQWRVRRFMG